jgi:threonine dehydratase
VAYSTGNHAIGLAWAAKLLGICARIYLPYNTSPVKQRAASHFGAEIIYTATRQEAELRSKRDIHNGYYYLHPSDHDATIAGAGTLCHEAINQLGFAPDAIFAGCGGGGLLSGSYLAKEWLSPKSLLFGTEPVVANDAFISLQQDSIYRLQDSPRTVADGLRTLSISPRTFMYLKKLDGFFTVSEHAILYWTAWLSHLLKVVCEPSSALNMQAVCEWLTKSEKKMKVLVLISGGNIDPSFYRVLWEEDYLLHPPLLETFTNAKAA